jgi:hypothetical protein
VDVEGASIHFEANDLARIRESLDGCGGRVHVYDRMSGSVLFQGTAEEVLMAIGTLTSLYATKGYEMDGVA